MAIHRLSIFAIATLRLSRWESTIFLNHHRQICGPQMALFLYRDFYKPYRLGSTFRIDRITHEEFKTMRAEGLAALEAEKWPFRFSQAGTNQGPDSKMTFFSYRDFYKPYRLGFKFRIDRIAHGEFKSALTAGIAALEAEIWIFCLIRSLATLLFLGANLLSNIWIRHEKNWDDAQIFYHLPIIPIVTPPQP